MANPSYGSIDQQLAGLSLNNENSSQTSLKSPSLNPKKKRPARAYHILLPQLDDNNGSVSPSPAFSYVGAPAAAPSGLSVYQVPHTSSIYPSHQFQGFQYSQQSQPYLPQSSQASLLSPDLQTQQINGSTASLGSRSVPYPTGSHSNPISPFTPPAPSALQFQYQSELQNGNIKRKTERVVSREITSNMPEQYTGKPYQPESSLSVPDQREFYQNEFWNSEFLTFQNACPPLATTDFKVVDQGTASPKFMTLSMYNLPATEKLRALSKLPVAVNIRPFAPVEEDGDEQVPEISWDYVNGGPLRCNRCRAYINSTVQFTHSNKFICNLCQFANPIPTEYSSPLDQNFRRVDHAQRPELNKGVVDYVLPEAYWEKENLKPVPLHQVFLIDVSVQAAQLELPRLTAEAIRASLYKWTEDGEEISTLPPGSKIAIITFDKNIQFYNLSSTLQQPTVSIMSDLEDPFIPFFDGLFVDPLESRMAIEETLALIESTSKFNRSSEVSYAAALNSAFIALHEFTEGQGGKISATLSTIPNYGPGSLSLKKYEDANLNKDHDKEKLVLEANNQYYKDLGRKFTKENVGLDLFAFPTFDMDLINTSYVVSETGGLLKLYNNFHPLRDERKFIFDFKKSIGDTVGYQGHLKVRCSSGLQVQEYYGNFSLVAKEPVIPTLNKNTTFDVLFTYDSKLNTKLDCHFQAAILYTTISGVRKVRVINLVSAVSERLVDVFSFVNQDVLMNLIIRDCVKHIPEQPLVSIQNLIDLKITSIFSQYRQYIVSKQALLSQFIIPDGLKTLASYILSFEKSRLLKTITSMTKNNLRIYNRYNLATLPLPQLSYYLYPYIVALHNLEDEDCEFNEIYLKYRLPKGVTASLSSIEYGGCYFTFNGQQILIWVHKDVNELFVQDLFGVSKVEEIDPLIDELPQLDTLISQQVSNLVTYFSKKFLQIDFLPVKVIRFGIEDQLDFLELLIEDKSMNSIPSYGEYLTQIHKQIRENISK